MTENSEILSIYGALFDGKTMPTDLSARYQSVLTQLNVPAVPSLNKADWGNLELYLRGRHPTHPLVVRMKIVAYLAETSPGHFETMHAPRPRNPLLVMLDISFCLLKAKLCRRLGKRRRLLYGL